MVWKSEKEFSTHVHDDFYSHTDIQSNLIDTRPSHRQATYIPVSNALLKTKFPPTNKTARSLLKKMAFHRSVPKNLSITTNSTRIRYKRELFNSTNPLPFDDRRILDMIDARNTTESINAKDTSESMPSPEFATVDNATSDDLYPNFHVTYWMFYPYSQVSSNFD